MATVKAPNTQYSGSVAGITFVNGVGDCNEPHLLDWFQRHGYKVEGADAPAKPATTIQEDPSAAIQSYENRGRPSEDAEVSKAMTAEQRRAAYGKGVGDLLISPTTPPVIGPSKDTSSFASAEDEAALKTTGARGSVAGAPDMSGKTDTGTGLAAGRGKDDEVKLEAPAGRASTEQVGVTSDAEARRIATPAAAPRPKGGTRKSTRTRSSRKSSARGGSKGGTSEGGAQ